MTTPDPVPMAEAEAIATLRTIARLQDMAAVKLYGGGAAAMPANKTVAIGFAVVRWFRSSRLGAAWHDRPTWVYDRAAAELRWCAPNALVDRGYVTWREIMDPTP